MLRYVLSHSDLGGVRFGLSPLSELGLSLRAIRDPARYPLQLPWLLRTEAARAQLDSDILMALVNDRLWTPDFLNPRPESALVRIEDELDSLRQMSRARFDRDLLSIHPTIPDIFGGRRADAVDRMVDVLQDYWDACFQPWWRRMRTILEADIVYRGRQIAQGGLAEMLNGLSSSVRFDGNVVSIALKSPADRTEATSGLGLTLVPTMFTRRASAPVRAGEPPLLMYPARGQGAMWETEQVENPAAIAELIGRARATLLVALAEPASSTELGVRFGVTASAVNQHLRALHAAGLVTSARHGHSMLYLRSELGQALLGGPQVSGPGR
jgi:DNA-binding transcriptional ArsR family regulator